MYNIKNISKNRSVVCTLKDGTSLRLLPKNEVTIKDNQITDYLIELSKQVKPIITVTQTKESVIDKKEGEKSSLKKTDKSVKENKEVK